MTIFNICKKILFIVLILIFGLALSCSKAPIEEDLEEKYLSALMDIMFILNGSFDKFDQFTSDYTDNKISLSDYKILIKSTMRDIELSHTLYLKLKPPKKFKKVNDLYGKSFEHLLKRNRHLQDFIDTEDSNKMLRYTEQVVNEAELVNKYNSKITDELGKVIGK
ncbi:hypothetical protein ES702_01271 [subsurface metagenome]